MPPDHWELKVDFRLELVQECSEGYEEESQCHGSHAEAHHDALHARDRVTQTWCHRPDEAGDAASDTDRREIDIEDVEETDLTVLADGEEEPEIEPKPENNNRQQTHCQHE